jgi:DNA-directed RNA polymerase subunit RPC12/RpoP
MSLIATLKSLFGFGSKNGSSAGDRKLVCMDCEKEFVFDAGEQAFFKEKGFTDPKRCPTCRKKVRFRMKRRGRGSFGRNKGHNNNDHGGRRRHHHALIDGDSPYQDER